MASVSFDNANFLAVTSVRAEDEDVLVLVCLLKMSAQMLYCGRWMRATARSPEPYSRDTVHRENLRVHRNKRR